MHAWKLCAAIAFATCASGAMSGSMAGTQDGGPPARDRDGLPVAEHFDRAELEQAMALGSGALRGVMGVSNREGFGGLLGRIVHGRQVALAAHEWVLLLPMTAHLQDWHARNSREGVIEREVRLHPEAWRFAGRSRTDADGNFSFDGLRPGRYLVLSSFIVPFRGTRTSLTGEYLYEYEYAGLGVGNYRARPVTRVERFSDAMGAQVGEVVEIREGAVTTFAPPSLALY
jgi:hypothetical protein